MTDLRDAVRLLTIFVFDAPFLVVAGFVSFIGLLATLYWKLQQGEQQ